MPTRTPRNDETHRSARQSQAPHRRRWPVAVVGFGPVAKALALLLADRGHEVVVVERRDRVFSLPRAVTHDAEFARTLQQLGFPLPRIADIDEPYDDQYVWVNADGEPLLEVDWSGTGASGWPNTNFFHQPELEQRLDEELGNRDAVTVLIGWEAVQVEQDDDEVRLLIRGHDGVETTIEAEYLVGADGANSVIARTIETGSSDQGYFFDWLVVDVKPGPTLRFPHIARQVCDPRRPTTMVPAGPGRRRWEFMRLRDESVDELNTTASAWRLLGPYGILAENATIERHSVYRFQARCATTWQAGRVMLAGDAAHLMPPFAGQGLCAGWRDAVAIAWRLDAVLSGVASPALLSSYGPERQEHVQTVIDFSVRLGRLICVDDPVEAEARDAVMRSEGPEPPPVPRLGPGLHHGEAGGFASVQGRVRTRRRIALLDDIIGGPGALISTATVTPLEDPVATRLHERRVASVRIADEPGPRQVVDVDGTYRRWLEELGADAVLIRPDGYVYSTACGAEAAHRLCDAFIRELDQGSAARDHWTTDLSRA